MKKFLKNRPLYESIKISKDNLGWLSELWRGTINIDGYCPSCGNNSTFTASPPAAITMKPPTGRSSQREKSEEEKYGEFMKKHRTFMRRFECARNEEHQMVYQFVIQDVTESEDRLIKVGQYPSPVDLQQLHKQEYQEKVEEILDHDKATEYKRAIMAYSHKFGIGAFVYLRRIFEDLIHDTYHRNIDQLTIGEKDFEQMGMKEQIKALKQFLPDVVNDNKHFYNILSKGIHELSQSECLDYFDVAREMVEYIVDKIYNKVKDKEKKHQLERELNQIHKNTTK